MTAEVSRFLHFDWERNPHNVERRHKLSSKKNKSKATSSVHKTTGIVSWSAEGCISVELLPQGETSTAARYVQTLRNLRLTLSDKRPGKREMVLQHEKARGPALLVSAWKEGRRMPENFSIHPTFRTQPHRTTVCSDSSRIVSKTSNIRPIKQPRKRHAIVSRSAEMEFCISTARASSDFQKGSRHA